MKMMIKKYKNLTNGELAIEFLSGRAGKLVRTVAKTFGQAFRATLPKKKLSQFYKK